MKIFTYHIGIFFQLIPSLLIIDSLYFSFFANQILKAFLNSSTTFTNSFTLSGSQNRYINSSSRRIYKKRSILVPILPKYTTRWRLEFKNHKKQKIHKNQEIHKNYKNQEIHKNYKIHEIHKNYKIHEIHKNYKIH